MERTTSCLGATLLLVLCALITPSIARAQESPPASSISRTELLKQVLPPGNFRNVQAVMVELPPGAVAARHRHDVAVVAYVLEGTVDNQFNAGQMVTHKQGEAWWEAPGTIHDLARNTSRSERARLLVVYSGEEGKTPTVPLNRD